MTLFNDLFLFQRIDHLIRTAATGTPKALAKRLEMSECSVYRLIGRLKDEGFPIAYDKSRQCYYYTRPFTWKVEFMLKDDTLLSMKGGALFLKKNAPLANFESARPDLCDVILQPQGYSTENLA